MRRFLFLSALLALSCSSKSSVSPPSPDSATDADDDTLVGPPPCTAAVDKGPWTTAMKPTSIKIRWESCKPGPGSVTYAPEGGGASVKAASKVVETKVTAELEAPLLRDADFSGTFYMHEVALDVLTEGTCYTYVVDTDASAKGRFCTARASGSPFSFVAIGDTNPGFGPTTSVLEKVYPKKPDFTIHGGDIQYYASGLETYTFWFAKMEPMLRSGAFMPAIGNHEAEKPTERVEYVDRFFGGAGFDGTIDYYRFSSGGVWFFSLDTELDSDPTTDQGKWLLAQLENAQKQPGFRFSVVYMHRPLVSCGDVSSPTERRLAYEPSFIKFGVKLVVGAHMHGYERFELGDLTYVTAAGGGGAMGNVDQNLSRAECTSRKVSGAFFHAVLFEVGATTLTGTAIDDKGAVRDTFTKTVP